MGDAEDGGDADLASADRDGGVAGACAAVPPPAVGTEEARCEVPILLRGGGPGTQFAIAGEWNGWSTTQDKLSGPTIEGQWGTTLRLLPGLYGYKFVEGGTRWFLDGRNSYRKYVGGVENSGLRVADCHRPSLKVNPMWLLMTRSPLSPDGKGTFRARIDVKAAVGQPSAICRVSSSLRRPDTHKVVGTAAPPLANDEWRYLPDRSGIEVDLENLVDGKYQLTLSVQVGGRDSLPLVMPFWIQKEPFQIADSPLYMAVTDRFADGDKANNQPVSGVRQAANFQGGDLQGVTAQIEAGYFDRMGVRALWLTPFYRQPDKAYPDQGGTIQVTGYHGYWPTQPREVDPRLGGSDGLHRLVESAHRHGIRVLMDAVLNHVHEEHAYFKDPQKRGWFRTGCLCGTAGCDWTTKRLECLFGRFMPDIDWTVTDASNQFIEDTLYWLEEYNLDGLRIDAVKHVEDLAIHNLGTRIREQFETVGTRHWLIGETAMGWNDGSVADNRENYDTIKRYIGKNALDGQFDFVWYHGVGYRVYAYEDKKFVHDDYWTRASQDEFKGSSMVNYLGSHDTSRFISQATYRDSTGMWAREVASHKWSEQGLPSPPPDDEPYRRLWLGMLRLLTIPGVPLLYYGDEYGEYGGGDPDNRHAMRFDAALQPREQAHKMRMERLLTARRALRGLRGTDDVTALLGEDVYAYARPDFDAKQSALVVLNRLGTDTTVAVPIVPELGWKPGMALRDHLGSTRYTMGGTMLMISVPARSAAIVAAE